MYVIAVYDVNKRRVPLVHKTMSKFLEWVQRSVFKGKITEGKLILLKEKLKEIINPNEDTVIFFILESENSIKRTDILGSAEMGNIL